MGVGADRRARLGRARVAIVGTFGVLMALAGVTQVRSWSVPFASRVESKSK
jgi:hypothetical protein